MARTVQKTKRHTRRHRRRDVDQFQEEIGTECSCAFFEDENGERFWIVFDCRVHRQLSDEQIELARRCATAYGSEMAWAYVNALGKLCVVCDMYSEEHRTGFMYDVTWFEFDVRMSDVRRENLHHVL